MLTEHQRAALDAYVQGHPHIAMVDGITWRQVLDHIDAQAAELRTVRDDYEELHSQYGTLDAENDTLHHDLSMAQARIEELTAAPNYRKETL